MYNRRSVKETKYLGYPNRSIARKKNLCSTLYFEERRGQSVILVR